MSQDAGETYNQKETPLQKTNTVSITALGALSVEC